MGLPSSSCVGALNGEEARTSRAYARASLHISPFLSRVYPQRFIEFIRACLRPRPAPPPRAVLGEVSSTRHRALLCVYLFMKREAPGHSRICGPAAWRASRYRLRESECLTGNGRWEAQSSAGCGHVDAPLHPEGGGCRSRGSGWGPRNLYFWKAPQVIPLVRQGGARLTQPAPHLADENSEAQRTVGWCCLKSHGHPTVVASAPL